MKEENKMKNVYKLEDIGKATPAEIKQYLAEQNKDLTPIREEVQKLYIAFILLYNSFLL